jgi:hypothetical protein
MHKKKVKKEKGKRRKTIEQEDDGEPDLKHSLSNPW